MTIIEQIRAEIERRIALFSSLSEDTVNPNRIDEDRQLLSFLSTLEAQEPEADLEEEIERRYDQAKWGYVDGFGSVCMDKGQFTRIARHFAKWGAEHAKK